MTSEGELAQDVAAEENPKMIKYLDELYASIDTDAERSKEEQLMFHDSAQFHHYYKKFNKVYEPEPIDPSTKAGPLHVAAAKGIVKCHFFLFLLSFRLSYCNKATSRSWILPS